MIKKLVFLIIVCLGMAFLFLLYKDSRLRAKTEKVISAVTGCRVHIQNLKALPGTKVINIKNIRIFNSKDFPDWLMFDIPEARVELSDVPSIKGEMSLKELKVVVGEMTVVRNDKGAINIDTLKLENKDLKKIPGINIDKLEVIIKKVKYKDYTKSGLPGEGDFAVNVGQEFTGIKDLSSVFYIIIVKALVDTDIPSIIGYDLSKAQGAVSGLLAEARGL